jgi:hypothetical protein
MYLLFIWRGMLMRDNSFGGPLEGWALKIEAFLGFARCHFRAQKSLDFQGPPLPMALEMDFPALKSLRPALYKHRSINRVFVFVLYRRC